MQKKHSRNSKTDRVLGREGQLVGKEGLMKWTQANSRGPQSRQHKLLFQCSGRKEGRHWNGCFERGKTGNKTQT